MFNLLDPFGFFEQLDELVRTPAVRQQASIDPVRVAHDVVGDKFCIRAVTPGFSEDELNVSVDGNRLTVSGKCERQVSPGNLHSSSRSEFSKTVALPESAAVEEVDAEYKNGILLVTVPLRTPAKVEAKSVPIRALGAGK